MILVWTSGASQKQLLITLLRHTLRRKHRQKRFKPADDTRLDLGSTSSDSDPKLHVTQCVNLRGMMYGMTQYSDDSVAIGYYDKPGIDIIDSAGTKGQYPNIPSNMKCL